jgi:hypothetical protein
MDTIAARDFVTRLNYVRLKLQYDDNKSGRVGKLLWHDHTFGLVKYYAHDKPVVEYLSQLEIIPDGEPDQTQEER